MHQRIFPRPLQWALLPGLRLVHRNITAMAPTDNQRPANEPVKDDYTDTIANIYIAPTSQRARPTNNAGVVTAGWALGSAIMGNGA